MKTYSIRCFNICKYTIRSYFLYICLCKTAEIMAVYILIDEIQGYLFNKLTHAHWLTLYSSQRVPIEHKGICLNLHLYLCETHVNYEILNKR